MDVIFNTIYPVKEAVFISDYAHNVSIKFSDMCLVESSPAVFCPEDQVIQDSSVT